MKKFFYLFMAFSAALVSCSKSEVVNAPGADTPISFYPYTGRANVTKAAEAGRTDLASSGFQVYGFMSDSDDEVVSGTGMLKSEKPYMDKVVSSTDGGITWSYTGNIYWPASNYLDFVAYGKNASITEDVESRTKIYYTIDSNVENQKDLLVAAPVTDKSLSQYENLSENEQSVTLQFSHLLSKIGFSLVTEGDGSKLVTLTQVDLVGNFYTQCEVDLTATKEVILADGTKVGRPYVSPKTDVERSTTPITYSLLGEAIGATGVDDASFTSYGSQEGVPVFNNSGLYTLTNPTIKDKVAFERNEVEAGTVTANQTNRFMMVYPVQDWGSLTVNNIALTNAQLVVTYFLPEYGEFETLTLDLKNGDKAITFDPGCSYEFKLKVSTYEIGFSAEVVEWDTATGIETGKEVFVLC